MLGKAFDLSHRITEETYHPSGFPSFQTYETIAAQGCRSARMTLSLHFATHLDAPWHFVQDGRRLDEFAIADFLGEAVVLDVSGEYGPERSKSRPVQPEDLEEAAKRAGLQVNEGDMVLIHTGWHHLYHQDPLRYYRDYCTLSGAAGAWLASRKVRLVGVDACDVDEHKFFEVTPPFQPPNHSQNFLPNDIFIIENVGGQIDQVLNRRVDLIVAPLNLAGFYAASSPIRLIALGAPE
jgi:kynurenine formamidase